MNKFWVSWLLILLVGLQTPALAADAHPLDHAPNDAVDNQVVLTVPAQAADECSCIENDAAHHDCPSCSHCCHCSWHNVAAFPVTTSPTALDALPPYRAIFQAFYSPVFLRPPKAA